MAIGDRLEIYTYDYLLRECLAEVPNTIDKREGSIIYDAVSPACMRLAEFYQNLRYSYIENMASTATGKELDLKVQEQGLTRFPATYAVKRAAFYNASDELMTVPLASRFSTISDTNPINYSVVSPYTDESGTVVPGNYNLQCEVAGSVGNEYTGNLLAISYIPGLARAVMSATVTPARDRETDDELRQRYFDAVNEKPFAGNIAAYKEYANSVAGVGDAQVYPVWDGGGTVKLSIVDAEFNPANPTIINNVENAIDPVNAQGEKGDGLGLAPIDHKVTVVAPTATDINIDATLVLMAGYTLDQLRTPITNALEEYFLGLRRAWATGDEYNRYNLGAYVSRVIVTIIGVQGVSNVTQVLLNGAANDIIFTEDGNTQELPMLGTVTLHEQ